MKNKKIYLILLISNAVFFGFFGFLLWYEMQHTSGWSTSPAGILFLPSCLMFAIWYGVFSYKKTGKPWLSNMIFLVFEIIFYTFICLTTDVLNISGATFFIYIVTSLSLIASFAAKSKIDKEENADEKQED